MENFTPSEYQQEIFTFIEKGVGNAVIDAKAGSGKTTTMVEGMKYIPQDQRALFVAFNKSICEELEKTPENRMLIHSIYLCIFFTLLGNIITEVDNILIIIFLYKDYCL